MSGIVGPREIRSRQGTCRGFPNDKGARRRLFAGVWPTGPSRPHRRGSRRGSDLAGHHHLLDLGDGLGRVQALGAGVGAVHDRVAAIEPERIMQRIKTPVGGLVAAVDEPAIGCQQGCRLPATATSTSRQPPGLPILLPGSRPRERPAPGCSSTTATTRRATATRCRPSPPTVTPTRSPRRARPISRCRSTSQPSPQP